VSNAVPKNEWTPQLKRMRKALSPAARKRRLINTGYKMVALRKAKMDQQKGFADNTPFRPLKIKWRYHGTKDVMATKKNIARATRGAQVRNEVFVKMVDGVAHVRGGKVIQVRARTKVTPASKAVIDTAATKNSFDVIGQGTGYVDVGNLTPFEKAKAFYNDDRLKADWGRVSTQEALDVYMADFDRQMGFA
jgi:hypothetical protein